MKTIIFWRWRGNLTFMKNYPKTKIVLSSGLILVILAFICLFLGFYRNQWQMARPKKFSVFQKDVESYVIARLVLSRQAGLLSDGGLLVWGDINPTDVNESDYQHQYDTYLDGLTFRTHWVKESHPGFQGIFFSLLDRLSPFSPSNNLRFFRMFASGLFAAVLAGFILWFYWELGKLSAIFVFLSILISQWMTLFGRNLFFVSGLFYLPALVLLFRLRGEKTGKDISYGSLFLFVFSLVLIKCLFNGYDFILPTLAMTATPIIFYGILEHWDREKFLKRFLTVVIAAIMAILASLVILSVQVAFASGNFQEGINSILQTLNRRTVSNNQSLEPIYQRSSNASTWSILKIYLSESYLSEFQVPYYAIIALFVIVSIIYFMNNRKGLQPLFPPAKGNALLGATWFSLLGPLSWYVIFKSVAYFHTHMNHLPWHMPFTLFGFGLCGFVIENYLTAKSKIDSKIKLSQSESHSDG